MTADALATRARYVALLRSRDRASGYEAPIIRARRAFSFAAMVALFWSGLNVR